LKSHDSLLALNWALIPTTGGFLEAAMFGTAAISNSRPRPKDHTAKILKFQVMWLPRQGT